MADGSRLEIIKANPIGKGLNTFHNSFESTCRGLAISGADTLCHISGEGPKNSLLDLIHALQGLSATRSLPSNQGNRDLLGDLLALSSAVYSGNFDIERIIPLLRAVLNNEPDEVIWNNVYAAIAASTAVTVAKPTTPPLSAPSLTASIQQTPWLHNTGSFANSTEHRKYIDDVPNNRRSISTTASLLCCPFLRLPPEIRCLIYRILLRSKLGARMIPTQDGLMYCPNDMYPSILGACRLIYQEARYVLYGENVFHARRINNNNHNAVLIRRARYHIGMHRREDGKDEARKLADFLVFQRELRVIELEFRFDLIEDPIIYSLVCQAIRGHRHLMDIKILSPLVFSKMGWRHSWRLWSIVRNQALLRERLQEKLK